MASMPDKDQQILQSHAGLIHRVVMACQNRSLVPDLDEILNTAVANGWTALVGVIREILKGRRDAVLLQRLDEEDQVIVTAILRGLQDPATLPDLDAKPDPALAAPALAAMIHATRRGDVQAMQMLSAMAETMLHSGGDMTRLSAVMHPLISGEREPEKLVKGMSPQGQTLVLGILAELAKLDMH
ncbi:MAG: hypothetical protein ACYDDO_10230 [Acidiferrobacterales bacterium]